MGNWKRNVQVSALLLKHSGKKKLEMWLLTKPSTRKFRTITSITAKGFASF
jgi:hypothetical protein